MPESRILPLAADKHCALSLRRPVLEGDHVAEQSGAASIGFGVRLRNEQGAQGSEDDEASDHAGSSAGRCSGRAGAIMVARW